MLFVAQIQKQKDANILNEQVYIMHTCIISLKHHLFNNANSCFSSSVNKPRISYSIKHVG